MFVPVAISLLLAALPQGLAAPQPNYAPPAYGGSPFCINNAKVVALLKACATAPAYCNSYLSVPTNTITKTVKVTPSPVLVTSTCTAKAKTTTITLSVASPYATAIDTYYSYSTVEIIPSPVVVVNTVSVTPDPTTTTIPVFVTPPPVTSATTVEATCASAGGTNNVFSKRDVATTIGKPAAIPKNWVASQISSGCSCMSNPAPSTTTTITTTLAPKTSTVKVTTTPIITKTKSVSSLSVYTSGYATTVTTFLTISDAPQTTTSVTTITLPQETITENPTSVLPATTVVVTNTVYDRGGPTYTQYSQFVDEHPGPAEYPSDNLKAITPDHSGTINGPNFQTDGNWVIQFSDGYQFDGTYKAVVMHAYFYFKSAGTFTLTIPGDVVDNWMTIWIGDAKAYNWVEAEANTYGNFPGNGGSTQYTSTGNELVPVTFLWGNSYGPGTSDFVIDGPDGTDLSTYLVTPCGNAPFTS